MEKEKFAYPEKIEPKTPHGSAMKGYYPHELILGYEVCQMKGTHIGVSELTLKKSYQFVLLRIRPLHCDFGP